MGREWSGEGGEDVGEDTTQRAILGSKGLGLSLVTQLCPTLCDAIDGSPPGSPIPGIVQARILEWVAISFSNA